MRAVSDRFMRAMAENSTMLVKASIIFSDGTKKELSGEDFFSLSVETASSSSGSFDVGAAVIGKLACALNNHDDRFSEFDFQGAVIRPYIGKSFGSETDWLPLGVFNCDQPDSYAGQIQLTALDNLSLMESKADLSQIGWPCTLQQLVDAACAKCGLVNDTSEIPNGKYAIGSIPDVGDASWLDVVAYAAQLACCFVVATDQGHVALKWYDTHSFEAEDGLDGGEFDASSPYSTGDKADGGDFTDYSNGAKADGGDFAAMKSRAMISMFSQLTVFTDDVVVTGVSVTAQNEVVFEDGKEQNGEDGESALYGSEGYVLDLGDNPLVLFGEAANVASMVGKRVVGMRFRPFSADAKCDPSVEVGDAAYVFDRKGNRYETYLTSLKLTVNGSESMACEAKSAGRNAAEKASAATEAVRKARNELKREKSSREVALDKALEMLENASGMFKTVQRLDDGSEVIWLHDKSDLQSSQIVWKVTVDGVGISVDGGKTYPTVLAASGVAILNRIYAVGIDADHITTGRLASKDGKNFIDLDTGEASLSPNTKIGDDEIATKRKTVIDVSIEYAQGSSASSAPSDGWSPEAPAWEKGKYIWSRTVTTMANMAKGYSDPVCISGRDGKDGLDGKSPSISVSKSGGVSTITTIDPDGSSSTVMVTDGVNGTSGKNGYVHVKYSDDGGVTFTDNGGEEPGKYLGIYTDNVQTDSTDVSAYAWALVKGRDGKDGKQGPAGVQGDMGIGVADVSEQWYLSTSDAAQVGGVWSSLQPAWSSGHYIWTRSVVKWTDDRTTYTTPVLARAINSANQAIKDLDSSLTQEGIMNRLTNGGADEGVYIEEGHLYINASMIKSGVIEGITVRSSGGDPKTELTKDGIRVTDKEGQDVLRLGYGIETGLSVVDPFGTGRLVELAKSAFLRSSMKVFPSLLSVSRGKPVTYSANGTPVSGSTSLSGRTDSCTLPLYAFQKYYNTATKKYSGYRDLAFISQRDAVAITTSSETDSYGVTIKSSAVDVPFITGDNGAISIVARGMYSTDFSLTTHMSHAMSEKLMLKIGDWGVIEGPGFQVWGALAVRFRIYDKDGNPVSYDADGTSISYSDFAMSDDVTSQYQMNLLKGMTKDGNGSPSGFAKYFPLYWDTSSSPLETSGSWHSSGELSMSAVVKLSPFTKYYVRAEKQCMANIRIKVADESFDIGSSEEMSLNDGVYFMKDVYAKFDVGKFTLSTTPVNDIG